LKLSYFIGKAITHYFPLFILTRAFLHFDTREFLNVLALAFQEPEFTSELGLQQVQRLVDILLLVMVQQGDGFTVSAVYCTFLVSFLQSSDMASKHAFLLFL
jgi:hypothetical protein